MPWEEQLSAGRNYRSSNSTGATLGKDARGQLKSLNLEQELGYNLYSFPCWN